MSALLPLSLMALDARVLDIVGGESREQGESCLLLR